MLPVVWALTVLIVAIVAGAPAEGLFDGVGLSSLVVLLVVLIPAFAEELAWRGFAVPRLLPFLSPLGAALVLAVPWTIMHLPLVLVPGSINEGLAVIPMVLALFSYSIILTWIFVGSGGSVLLTAIVHAGLNGVVPIFQNLDADEAWLWRGVIAAVIAVLVILFGNMQRRISPAAEMNARSRLRFLDLLFFDLGQHVGGVRIAEFGQTPKLLDITSLSRQLDKLGRGVELPIGELAKLFHVASLARKLDELVDGLAVAGCGPGTQVLHVLTVIDHSEAPHSRHEARRRRVPAWDGEPPNWPESSSRASSRRS